MVLIAEACVPCRNTYLQTKSYQEKKTKKKNMESARLMYEDGKMSDESLVVARCG